MENVRAIDRLPARIDDALDGEPVDNVYVLYLEDMIWTFIPPTDQQNGNSMGYVQLSCFARAGDILTCSDGIIDLDRGVMISDSGEIPLRAALFVNDGYVVDRKDFAVEHGYYLQIVMKQNKVNMILVADEPLFRSNFNQQYLLGNYDRNTFSEAYNASPMVRVLKANERMPMITDEKKTQGKFRSAR
jgi:dolichyl-diphosphooligosaccharide--protein glycosyltransferase